MRIVRFLFLLLSSAAFASAQVENGTPPLFTHDALSCMSTDDFPVVEAAFEPAELRALRKAQVYFKAGQTDAWYFVEMEPGEESRLHATLPKPLAETARVDYYLFFLSVTFEPAHSEEFSVHVSETGCGTIRRAVTSSPMALTLRATVLNQAPIPPGFSPQGISSLVTTAGNTVSVGSAAVGGGGAASGGISGVTVGAVAGGGAAAAAAVVVSKGSDGAGDSDSTTTSPDAGQESGSGAAPTSSAPSPDPEPTPTPPPPPAPSLPDVSGRWTMNSRIIGSCRPEMVGETSTTPMEFQQNGTALTASSNGPNFTENLAGTIDMAGNIAMRGSFSDESDTGESRIEATTTTGSDMSGRYVRIYPAYDCTIRWTFTGSKN